MKLFCSRRGRFADRPTPKSARPRGPPRRSVLYGMIASDSEPEVRPAQALVVEECRGRALEDEPATLEDAGSVRDGERLADVLLDEQYGDAVAVDRLHDLEDPAYEQRSEAERGLVEHEQPRPGHQGPADGAHLLLAAGEGPGELGAPLGERRKEGVDVGQTSLALPPSARRMRAEQEVLAHGQEGKESPPLGHLDDAGLDAPVRG